MKVWVVLLVLLSRLAAADYELIVLAGQSNAQGWKGDAKHYPLKSDAPDSDIPFYYHSPKIGSSNGKWTFLGPQEGRYPRGHFGPEVGLARHLVSNGLRPAIFKFTLGGTGLERAWKRPGDGGLYDQMVRELTTAVRQLTRQGHRVRISALFWIQGEADAIDAGISARYQENLNRLIRHFRSSVAKRSDLPVILGVDEQHPLVVRRPIIVVAQKNLATADKNIRHTSMLGLKKTDRSHLKPSALIKHGELLASSYLEMRQSR